VLLYDLSNPDMKPKITPLLISGHGTAKMSVPLLTPLNEQEQGDYGKVEASDDLPNGFYNDDSADA
jgi:hypothetical protein